jgi:hypothetical protein
MNPALAGNAFPSELRPSPLICEWGAIRDDRAVLEELGTVIVGSAEVLAIFWGGIEEHNRNFQRGVWFVPALIEHRISDPFSLKEH